VRDARKAHIAISANLPSGAFVTPLTSGDVANLYNSSSPADPLSFLFEGQITVTTFLDQAAHRSITAMDAIAALKRFLASFGEVKALHSCPASQARVRDFRVEFYKVYAAANLLAATEGRVIQSEVSHFSLHR
jgi:hypothetical protein